MSTEGFIKETSNLSMSAAVLDPTKTMATPRAFTGYKPSRPDERDYEIIIDDDRLPLKPGGISTFSIFEKTEQAKHWNGPLIYHSKDQGDTSMCVAHAVGSAYTYAYAREHSIRTPDGWGEIRHFHPSRMFLYYLARLIDEDPSQWAKLSDFANNTPTMMKDADNGTYISTVCRIVCQLGACDEPTPGAAVTSADVAASVDAWPFFDYPWDTRMPDRDAEMPLNHLSEKKKKSDGSDDWRFPSGSLGTMPPAKGCYTAAVKHRALEYAQPKAEDVEKFEMWKRLIVNGYPIIFAVDLFREPGKEDEHDKFYPCQDNGFVPATPTKADEDAKSFSATHVLLAVGWNDGKKAFLLQDSYGLNAYGDPVEGNPPGAGRGHVDGKFKHRAHWKSGMGRWYMPYSWLTTESPHPIDETVYMLAREPYVLINKK